jgi:flagellar hook-associated protein 1 FlgK
MSLLHNITIGASGMNAASAALSATSQNVVNASTPGYHRRRVDLSTRDPSRVPAGIAGRGVSVEGFRRQGSDLLTQQQIGGEGALAQSAAKQKALAPLEGLLDETRLSGPHAATTAFFDAMQAATADPSDAGLRRDVVARARTMTRTFRATADGFDQTLEAQRGGLEARVEGLNDVARKLADVNRDIVAQGQPADLLDERDRLLKEAGRLVGATGDLKHDGTANLLVAGHPVVSGENARTVSLTDDFRLAVDVDNGAIEVEAGGEVGGLVEAMDLTTALRSRLNDTAAALADAVNLANGGGFDAGGNPGGAVLTYTAGDPAATFEVLGAVDDDPGLLAFAGDPSAAAGDSANLEALIAVQDQALVGGDTVVDALSSLTTDVASEVARATSDAEHGARVLADLDGLQASLSGVDLDEEAADLLMFQTAYQASAKVITVNDQLIGSLLEIV